MHKIPAVLANYSFVHAWLCYIISYLWLIYYTIIAQGPLNNDNEQECVALNKGEFQAVIEAFVNGDSSCLQRLLKVSHISNGRIYSDSGCSKNLLHICTITQQVDIFKQLIKNYSINPIQHLWMLQI